MRLELEQRCNIVWTLSFVLIRKVNYLRLIQYTVFSYCNQLNRDSLLRFEIIQIVLKLDARPQTPACIPHGFGAMGIPIFLENIINSVIPMPIERPVKIDLAFSDLICNPRKMAGATWQRTSSFISVNLQIVCGRQVAKYAINAIIPHENSLPVPVRLDCDAVGRNRLYMSCVKSDDIARSAESTVDIMAATAAERKSIIKYLTPGIWIAISFSKSMVISSLPCLSSPGNLFMPTIPTTTRKKVVTIGIKTII